MGNIVYVSNQKIVSDYNALQLELTHIIKMSLSNPTTVGQTTPATWQPPLPTYAPPPLPSSESISTTPASTPAVTQPFYVNYIDQSHLNPVRRLDSDPSFSTPTSTQFRDLSSVYGTPPYQNATSLYIPQLTGIRQSLSGQQQSPILNPIGRSVMKSPSDYIRAGTLEGRRSTRSSSASAYPLSRDENGQQYTSLRDAAADRQSDLQGIFTAYNMIYPFLPVDQDISQFPLIFTNPVITQLGEKLWQQVARIPAYFRNCAQRRDDAFRLDHLGELAYKDGRCDLYHKHAANMLEALRALDLLKVAVAIVTNNFVLTIDEASTSIARQMLDDIVSNMTHNSFVLLGSVTPLNMVVWEYLNSTPRNVVTTLTAMQLVKMTAALLESMSRFLHRDTLTSITGDITSGLHRQIDPTLVEILCKLLLYEETEQKEALRRKFLKREMFQPLHTTSLQQAEKMWGDRKQMHQLVFQTPAFPFLIEEFHELVRCLSQSFKQHADKLQEHYALMGFPSDIGDVFQRLRSLCDSSVITASSRLGSRNNNPYHQYSVSFAAHHRDHGRHRLSRHPERESDVSQSRFRNRRSGHDNERHGGGQRRHDRAESERSRGRSRFDNHRRDHESSWSRSRSRSLDSRGSQSDFSHDSTRSRSHSPGDRRGGYHDRDRRGRLDRTDSDRRGRADSLEVATRRLRERGQHLERFPSDHDHRGQHSGRPRTPPASHRNQSTAELNVVQQTPPMKATEPPRRSQSPSQARTTSPRAPSPKRPTTVHTLTDVEREKRRQALRLQQAKIAVMQAEIDREDSASRISVVFASNEQFGQSTSESAGDERSREPLAIGVRQCDNIGSTQVSHMPAPEPDVAWNQLSLASRIRRRALKEQQAKRDSIDLPDDIVRTALQNMIRIHDERASINHVARIEGSPATLVDPGAMVSATSTFDLTQFITVIDTNDRVDLQSFSGSRERQLVCLGSALKQIIAVTTGGALTVFVYKVYIMKTNTNIDIMSTHELTHTGGSAHFGTQDALRITQTVDGTVHEYEYNNGGSYLISPLGGGVEMTQQRRLYYLLGYDPTLYHTRQEQINSLLEDVRSVYTLVAPEELSLSYTNALQQAIGRQQNEFAVSALNSYRPLPNFPPNLNLYDPHDEQDSLTNPVSALRDSFARVAAHAAMFDGDEHQEQRDLLLQRIETATQELAEISPTLANISNLRIGNDRHAQLANQVSIEFNGTEMTDTAGPAPFSDPFVEPLADTASRLTMDELNVAEGTVGHTTATRTPESIRKAGMFSPGGLKIAVIQTASSLALFALVCLTIFPDATVDVFSNATASELYTCVPVAQRHRLILHRIDPRALKLTTMQLALQDHDRSCRHIDFLHVEDLDPGYSHVVYQDLIHRLLDFNPDLLCTFRNQYEDRSLGSKLNGSMRYLVEHPPAIHRIQMVPCMHQGNKDKSVLDQDSVQIEWAETVLELFDDYITDKYNVPICVGLFLYEDLAEIAFNNLDAAELVDEATSTMGQCAVNSSGGKPPPSTTRRTAQKRPYTSLTQASSEPKEQKDSKAGIDSSHVTRRWDSVLVPW